MKSGFILLAKPAAYTSADAINILKGKLKKILAIIENAEGRGTANDNPVKGFYDLNHRENILAARAYYSEDWNIKNKEVKNSQINTAPKLSKANIAKLRIGHTGTLDKFAEGLLICPFGQATKFSPRLTHLNKEYKARIRFGISTDTHDPSGQIIKEWSEEETRKKLWVGESFSSSKSHSIANESVNCKSDSKNNQVSSIMKDILCKMEGWGLQLPPVFSAKKIKGIRASDLMRSGIVPELKKKKVYISFKQMSFISEFVLEFTVLVSSGTYIRSIARDIENASGIPVTLEYLERTSISTFSLFANPVHSILLDDKKDRDFKLDKLQSGQFILYPDFSVMEPYYFPYKISDNLSDKEKNELILSLSRGKKIASTELKSNFALQIKKEKKIDINQGNLASQKDNRNIKLICEPHVASKNAEIKVSDLVLNSHEGLLWSDDGKLLSFLNNIEWEDDLASLEEQFYTPCSFFPYGKDDFLPPGAVFPQMSFYRIGRNFN